MDGTPNSLQSEEPDQRFMNKAARSAAALFAAGAFAGGLAAGIESKHAPGPEVRANVPHQADAKATKELLELAASQNSNKEGLDRIWTGAIVLPTGTYLGPVGEAGIVVPPGKVAIIKLPRMVHYSAEEDGGVFIVGTLASDTKTENRAIDPKQDILLSLDNVQQEGATFYAVRGLPPALGYASVGKDGNLKFGTIPFEDLSNIRIEDEKIVRKLIAAGELTPTLPTAGR